MSDTVIDNKLTHFVYILELISGTISIPYQNKIKFFNSKIPCHVRCPICLLDKSRRGRVARSFRSIQSLIKHIREMHQSVKNVPPTFQEVYLVLESIVIALENKIAIDLLKKPVEWGMVVN